MAGQDSIPRFFDPERPPAPGGWLYWLDPGTKIFPINGTGPVDVFDQLKSYLLNNAKFVSDEAIWRDLWAHWCRLQPARCAVIPGSTSVQPGEVPKNVWGPILWLALNHLANHFDRTFFLSFVAQMQARLIPCEECLQHFTELLALDPVEAVTTRSQACLWVWRIHNRVNQRINKPLFPYPAAVAQFGFPTT